jgi:transcriptional regulator with XRE-family HTH domain
LRQFSEAAETHFTHLSRVERGKSGVPQLALILRLAGSLNVRCGSSPPGSSGTQPPVLSGCRTLPPSHTRRSAAWGRTSNAHATGLTSPSRPSATGRQ